MCVIKLYKLTAKKNRTGVALPCLPFGEEGGVSNRERGLISTVLGISQMFITMTLFVTSGKYYIITWLMFTNMFTTNVYNLC